MHNNNLPTQFLSAVESSNKKTNKEHFQESVSDARDQFARDPIQNESFHISETNDDVPKLAVTQPFGENKRITAAEKFLTTPVTVGILTNSAYSEQNTNIHTTNASTLPRLVASESNFASLINAHNDSLQHLDEQNNKINTHAPGEVRSTVNATVIGNKPSIREHKAAAETPPFNYKTKTQLSSSSPLSSSLLSSPQRRPFRKEKEVCELDEFELNTGNSASSTTPLYPTPPLVNETFTFAESQRAQMSHSTSELQRQRSNAEISTHSYSSVSGHASLHNDHATCSPNHSQLYVNQMSSKQDNYLSNYNTSSFDNHQKIEHTNAMNKLAGVKINVNTNQSKFDSFISSNINNTNCTNNTNNSDNIKNANTKSTIISTEHTNNEHDASNKVEQKSLPQTLPILTSSANSMVQSTSRGIERQTTPLSNYIDTKRAQTSYAGSVGRVGGAFSQQARSQSPARKPQWLSAVERAKREDVGFASSYSPILPPEQNKLGLQARRAAQQGELTTLQLRSHEMMFNDKKNGQPNTVLNAYISSPGNPKIITSAERGGWFATNNNNSPPVSPFTKKSNVNFGSPSNQLNTLVNSYGKGNNGYSLSSATTGNNNDNNNLKSFRNNSATNTWQTNNTNLESESPAWMTQSRQVCEPHSPLLVRSNDKNPHLRTMSAHEETLMSNEFYNSQHSSTHAMSSQSTQRRRPHIRATRATSPFPTSSTLVNSANLFANTSNKGVLMASESVHTSHFNDSKNLLHNNNNNSNVHYPNSSGPFTRTTINSPSSKTLLLPSSELSSVHTICNKTSPKTEKKWSQTLHKIVMASSCDTTPTPFTSAFASLPVLTASEEKIQSAELPEPEKKPAAKVINPKTENMFFNSVNNSSNNNKNNNKNNDSDNSNNNKNSADKSNWNQGNRGNDKRSSNNNNNNNNHNNNNNNNRSETFNSTSKGKGKKESNNEGASHVEEKMKDVEIKHGDEEERDEHNFRLRNVNALHAIPWDQRRQLPMTSFGTRFFALLSSPRFWEKLDWTVRGSLITVLPTMILSLEPSTSYRFPMASLLAFNAFWITMPTFGSGLRELYIALKGFCVGFVLFSIVLAIRPKPEWLTILILFILILVTSMIAQETKKTCAYILAATMMQYIADENTTHYSYIRDYLVCLLISLSFGLAGFLIPFIRWSSDIARHYTSAMGTALSISVQGTCSSFWTRNPMERELNVVRLQQLRVTAEMCIQKIQVALSETGYEPHLGIYVSRLRARFEFCKQIHNILGSMVTVIELIASDPTLIDTPMCTAFGQEIGDDLAIISSAMDSMILKIVDFHRLITANEIAFFREARDRFQAALSRVREDVILTNENYETDEADVFLGFFMFSVDELCDTISNFNPDGEPYNALTYLLTFPLRDVRSAINAFKFLYEAIMRNRTITRRLKESIKLSLCMTVPCIFQVYALDNNATSPMAGAAIIALIYNPTGSESFHYASGRLQGTVLGSMAALMGVQIAHDRRYVLYIFIAILSFIGAYVQAAPGFYALGNAIVCSTISIMTQYTDQNAAMTRIQQNCFAILLYFIIACLIWPMRGHTKVKMGLDVSLRCLRESTARLLRNLDMPEQPLEVVADVSALLKEMSKKINLQVKFIPGAIEEPTMSSAEFPEDAWKDIVVAQRKIYATVFMMNYAYQTFMSSRADSDTELSVHWVILHRIAEHARDLSDLVYATIDLYLLSLARVTVVPTTHLTRLRRGMMDAHEAILNTYIQTIQRQVAGEDDDDDDNDGSNNKLYSYSKKFDSNSSSSFSGRFNNGISMNSRSSNNNDNKYNSRDRLLAETCEFPTNQKITSTLNNNNNKSNNNNDGNATKQREGSKLNNSVSNSNTVNATTMAAPVLSAIPATQNSLLHENNNNGDDANNVTGKQEQEQEEQEQYNRKHRHHHHHHHKNNKRNNNNNNNNNNDSSSRKSDIDSDSNESNDNDMNNDNSSSSDDNNTDEDNPLYVKKNIKEQQQQQQHLIARKPKNTKKKPELTRKKAYLTYNLTPEERERLKEFVNLKVNNSMFSRSFGNKPASFLNLSSLAAGLATNFNTNASGPSEVENHDTRLLAMAGSDDGLAAELRKKHKITVETVEENAKRNDKDANNNNNDNNNINSDNIAKGDTNRSFMYPKSDNNNGNANTEKSNRISGNSIARNNTFAFNESVLGSLFKRRASRAPQRKNNENDNRSDNDLDSNDFFSAAEMHSYVPHKRNNEINVNQPNKDNDTENASHLEERKVTLKPTDNKCHLTINLEKSNILDYQTNTKSGELDDEVEMKPMQMASSQPSKTELLKSIKKVLLPSMASSAPSFIESNTSNILAFNTIDESKESSCTAAIPSSSTLVNHISCTPGAERANTADLLSVNLHTNELVHNNTSPHSSATRNRTIESAVNELNENAELSVFAPDADAYADAGAGANTTNISQTIDKIVTNNKTESNIESEKPKSSLPCSDDSNKSHSSEKNVINSNNKIAPLCVSPNDLATSNDVKEWVERSVNNDKECNAVNESCNCNSNHFNIDESKVNKAEKMQGNSSITHSFPPFTKYVDNNSIVVNEGQRPLIEFENNIEGIFDPNSSMDALNNISFFDADRGEFILTNKDVHSLEAFLFGTRALVVYINELQNAILQMQHANEIAKQL